MNAELKKLLRQISEMGQTEAKVELLEQAIQMADSANDVPLAFELRSELVETAEWSGHPEKVLVAFSWNLAQMDKDPDEFDEFQVLWQFKWVIPALCEFPEISRLQLEESMQDLAQRFERSGASVRPVHTLRCKIARDFGDRETIQSSLSLWKKSRRDWLSDCEACDQDSMMQMHFFLEQDEEGLRAAKPILDAKMSCAEVPHITLPQVLIPLIRLGRLDEAKQHQRRGYSLVKGNQNYLVAQADHLVFLVLIQDLKGALKLFESHLKFAINSHSPLRRYKFYRATAHLFSHLQKTSSDKLKLRLPPDFPLTSETGQYDAEELRVWFDTEARNLAKRFDVRNGNTFRTDEMNALGELDRYLLPANGE